MQQTHRIPLQQALRVVLGLAVLWVVMCGLPYLTFMLFGDPTDDHQRVWFLLGGIVVAGVLEVWWFRHRRMSRRQQGCSTAPP
jgi:hypothetical protein